VFARIGLAKIDGSIRSTRVEAIEDCLLAGFATPVECDALPEAPRAFLKKLLPDEHLGQLLGARDELLARGLYSDNLAFLALSRIVDLSSHSQTDGIYKAPTSTKRGLEPRRALSKVFSAIKEDVTTAPAGFRRTRSSLVEKSSEIMSEVADGSVSHIVTSPPYLNNFDYAEMTRMLLYFWGLADSWAAITDRVRKRLVVNTTTALSGHRERQIEYRDAAPESIRSELDELVAILGNEKKSRRGKKDYDLILYPYMHQMTKILAECFRCLRKGGRIHIMVSDAAFYGVHVASPQMLVDSL
jgi:hypothetical protein